MKSIAVEKLRKSSCFSCLAKGLLTEEDEIAQAYDWLINEAGKHVEGSVYYCCRERALRKIGADVAFEKWKNTPTFLDFCLERTHAVGNDLCSQLRGVHDL